MVVTNQAVLLRNKIVENHRVLLCIRVLSSYMNAAILRVQQHYSSTKLNTAVYTPAAVYTSHSVIHSSACVELLVFPFHGVCVLLFYFVRPLPQSSSYPASRRRQKNRKVKQTGEEMVKQHKSSKVLRWICCAQINSGSKK